jgi:hypothetical protein
MDIRVAVAVIGILISSCFISRQNWAAESVTYTNADIVHLSSLGMKDEIIIAFIQAETINADVTPQGVLALEKAGVHDSVIKALLAKVSASDSEQSQPTFRSLDPNDLIDYTFDSKTTHGSGSGTAESAGAIAPPAPDASVSLPPAHPVPRPTCDNALTFAIADGVRLDFRFPHMSEKWVKKIQSKYKNICFPQLRASDVGRTNYLVVLSTSSAAFNGLFPKFTTTTEWNTTPVSGSGSVTDYYGRVWNYSYTGSVTTTTTSTYEQNLPYTDTTYGYFANAYSEGGDLVAWQRQFKTVRSGGDPANSLGYNLGTALFNRHPEEKLLENLIKRLCD